MIKALFFDFDGVLTLDKTGSLTTTRYFSEVKGIEHARVRAAFATYSDDPTRGRCTHAAVWAGICHDLVAEVDIALLENAFASTPLNVGMLALVERLRPSYIVGVTTDNEQDRMIASKGCIACLPYSIPSSCLLPSAQPKPIVHLRARTCLGQRCAFRKHLQSITPPGTPRYLARWKSTASISMTKQTISLS